MAFAGANIFWYDQMWANEGPGHTLQRGPTAARIFLDASDYPNTIGYASQPWPPVSNNGRALVSIRPDIPRLLNGDFDDGLIDFIACAPGGHTSLLTIWHEAATLHRFDRNYPQKAGDFLKAQNRVNNICALARLERNADVRFGTVNVNELQQDTYDAWVAPGLDWYGCDLYDDINCDTDAALQLDDFQRKMSSLPGGTANPPINIPECNSREASPVGNGGPGCGSQRRADFFLQIWQWLAGTQTGNSAGMLTFWGGTGGESPEAGWDPDDLQVNGALSIIFSESSP